MARLNPRHLTELGDRFLAFAQAVGNYRMENRVNLSKTQNQRIKDLHWTLLNYADDLFTTSAKLIIQDIQTSLDKIRNITKEIHQTYQNLQNVEKAIQVAEAGVTLGGAIFSKNPVAIAEAIGELERRWRKK